MPKTSSKWQRFVRDVIGDDRQQNVADRTGIDQTTISRWLSGGIAPSALAAVQFARAYGINPVEALVASGFITAAEAKLPRPTRADLSKATAAQLASELARRASNEGAA